VLLQLLVITIAWVVGYPLAYGVDKIISILFNENKQKQEESDLVQIREDQDYCKKCKKITLIHFMEKHHNLCEKCYSESYRDSIKKYRKYRRFGDPPRKIESNVKRCKNCKSVKISNSCKYLCEYCYQKKLKTENKDQEIQARHVEERPVHSSKTIEESKRIAELKAKGGPEWEAYVQNYRKLQEKKLREISERKKKSGGIGDYEYDPTVIK